MARSRVSVRGQTVIPSEIRKQLGITPDDVLDWKVIDGAILVQKLPADPFRASRGILKGVVSFDEFMTDREEERRKERALEARS